MRNVVYRPGLSRHAARWLAVGAALLSTWAHAQDAPDFSKIEVRPVKLADNFYFIDEAEVNGGSISVFTGPDGVVMVDTGLAPMAPKVEAAIRGLSPHPIRYVINTHVHIDQTEGNEHFGHLGAIIIARDEVRHTLQQPRTIPGRVQRKPLAAPGLPRLTFNDAMTLHFNGNDIRLIAIPGAHTDGDTLIYFPGPDILVAGDALRPNEYPSINRPDGGTLQGMLDALARMSELAGPGTRIVTSHGFAADRAAVIAQRNLILTVRDRVAALMAQGRSENEIVAAQVTDDLGARQLHTSAERFVRDVYAELKAGR